MSSSAIWQSKTRIVRDGKNLDAHVTLTDSGLRFAYKDKAEFIELNRVRDVRIKVVENRFTHAKHQTGWVGFSIDGEKHRTEVFASSQSEALASGIDAAIQRMASRSSISPDKFASIADEIRTLVPNNVSEALLRVMGELRRSNPGSVYLASRKYLNIAGKKAADYGFVGLIWEWVRGTGDEYAATPFDVGLYLRPAKVQTGDVILTYYIDTK